MISIHSMNDQALTAETCFGHGPPTFTVRFEVKKNCWVPRAGDRWRWIPKSRESLPLDRTRRLRSNVVHHSIDALHLIHDARRDELQHFMRERNPIGGHAIFRADGAN